jgi:hypothetical protein
MFSKAGFDVEISTQRGLLWDHLFIVGVKK